MNSKKSLPQKRLVENACFACVGQRVTGVPGVTTINHIFIELEICINVRLVVIRFLLQNGLHLIKRDASEKMVLDDFLMGRQKSGISMLSLQRMLEIKSYKIIWVMEHKIRKAVQDRNAYYKLIGLIEMDDSYLGASKPGKRGRGAAGKAKIVVAVERLRKKCGFSKIQQIEK